MKKEEKVLNNTSKIEALNDDELKNVSGGCSKGISVDFESRVEYPNIDDKNYLYQIGDSVKFVENINGKISENQIKEVRIRNRSWATSNSNFKTVYVDMYTVEGSGVSSSCRYGRGHFVKQ